MRVLTVPLAALCACTLRLAGAAECPDGNLLAYTVDADSIIAEKTV